MEKAFQREIEIIMQVLECPKGFTCYKSGFKKLCSANDIGLQSFLECREMNPKDCKFSLDYGGLYFCKCVLRNRIKKKIGK